MHRLLIRNIKTLVSCDAEDRVYENVNLYCEDGLIRSIGPEAPAADEVPVSYTHLTLPTT